MFRQIESVLLVTAAAVVLSGCASTGPQTASGVPEVTISAPAPDVKRAVLANAQGTLIQESEHTLVYTAQMSVGQEFLTRFALGSAYSSQPKFIVTYNIVPLDKGLTRLTGHAAIDMKSAFGGEQGMSLDHGKAGGELQSQLEFIKQQVEGGSARAESHPVAAQQQQQQSSNPRQVPATRPPPPAPPSASPTPQQHEQEIQNPNVPPD